MEISGDIRWYRIKIPHKFDNSDLDSSKFESPFVFVRCRLLLAMFTARGWATRFGGRGICKQNKNKIIIGLYFHSRNILSVIVK
jgi:hypothetical protein